MPSILFVCTVNRYRSPIAAACFLKKLQEEGKTDGWIVGSAGTWTEPGLPPVFDAIQFAHQIGLEIEGHTSRVVDEVELSKYDLILVMEAGHKEAIGSEFPHIRDRVFLLSEVVDGVSYDILDPLEVGDTTIVLAKKLCDLIEKGFHNICLLAQRLSAQPGL